ncbi:hypothetical protein GCM10027563_27140 [Parasphingorhabdus pacifica]
MNPRARVDVTFVPGRGRGCRAGEFRFDRRRTRSGTVQDVGPVGGVGVGSGRPGDSGERGLSEVHDDLLDQGNGNADEDGREDLRHRARLSARLSRSCTSTMDDAGEWIAVMK